MSLLGTRTKDPHDVRIYTIAWSGWLGTATITTSTWVLGTGLTNVLEASTATTTSIKVSGGTNGKTVNVANRIQTSAGETRQVSFDVQVETQ